MQPSIQHHSPSYVPSPSLVPRPSSSPPLQLMASHTTSFSVTQGTSLPHEKQYPPAQDEHKGVLVLKTGLHEEGIVPPALDPLQHALVGCTDPQLTVLH